MAFCLEQEKDGNAARCADENAAGRGMPVQTPVSGIRPCLGRSLASCIWDCA